MSGTASISVCLLTYNRSELLPATIDSLLNQSYKDFELIICDDASTDNTPEVCRYYERTDKRIKVHRNNFNLGMPGNLNLALSLADGDYVANLHDGDLYREDLLSRWKDALDNHPSAGFVFNAYETITSKGEKKTYVELYNELIPGKELGIRLLSNWDSCVYGTVMARREVYKDIGSFDPQFGNFSDVDMWLRIAASYDVAYVNEPLMFLMPRDPSRFYSFIHWQVIFWYLLIHVNNLVRYHSIIPEFVERLWHRYPTRRRNLFLYHFLFCIKHSRWDRVKEALAIWRDSDDGFLKFLGTHLGDQKDTPEWYRASLWISADNVRNMLDSQY
jgi:glycosyltransferase involved in cell wall biosynthesis